VQKGEVEGEGERTEGQRREKEHKSGGDEQLQQQLGEGRRGGRKGAGGPLEGRSKSEGQEPVDMNSSSNTRRSKADEEVVGAGRRSARGGGGEEQQRQQLRKEPGEEGMKDI
jgi:hypothetical protein